MLAPSTQSIAEQRRLAVHMGILHLLLYTMSITLLSPCILGWAVAGPIGHFLISISMDRSFLVWLLQRGRGGDKKKIGR